MSELQKTGVPVSGGDAGVEAGWAAPEPSEGATGSGQEGVDGGRRVAARKSKKVKVSLNKSVRKDGDFGCDFRRQRNIPREEAGRVYNRLIGKAVTAEELSRGGELRAVWLHEKDIAFLRAYSSLRKDETLWDEDIAGVSEPKKKALKNTDDFLAFGGKVSSTGALEEAELLLQAVRPGPTWTVADQKMKSAAALASVESRLMSARVKLKWMEKLAAAAEARTWVTVKKEFAAERARLAKLSREGKLPAAEAGGDLSERVKLRCGSDAGGWLAALVTPVKGLLGLERPASEVVASAERGRRRCEVKADAARKRRVDSAEGELADAKRGE